MPIIDLVIAGATASATGAPLPQNAARLVADAIGAALGAEPGRVWVRLHVLGPHGYAENGCAGSAPPQPVFVTVLHAHPPEGAARVAEIAALTQAVAACLGRPAGQVHIEYAPPGAGRVAFGGRLVV